MPDVNFGYILNRMYPDGLADSTFRDPKNTLLALIGKDTEAHGSGFEVSFQYSLGGGQSADYATARKNNTTGSGKKAFFTYKNDYAFAYIDAKDMAAAKNGGGIVPALEYAMRNAMKRSRQSHARGVWGDGSGVLAKVKTVTTGSFTVTDWRDLKNVAKDVVLQANPVRTGSIGTIRAGTMLVTAVDRNVVTPTVYYTAVGGFTGLAVNDFLYIEGDYDSKIQGVPAWIPDTAPVAGDSFGNIDRSTDPQRLAGLRVDMSSASTQEQALELGMEQFDVYNCDTTHVFVSPSNYIRLGQELSAKKRIIDVPNKYQIGIKGILLANGATLLEDPYCPINRAYCLDINTWTLMSMGDTPHLVDEDKLKMLRVATADAFEAILRSWPNVKCEDPSQNGVIFLPP